MLGISSDAIALQSSLELQLSLIRPLWRSGETVVGHLEIDVRSAIGLNELAVELNGFEELRATDLTTSTRNILELDTIYFQKEGYPPSQAVITPDNQAIIGISDAAYPPARLGRTRFKFEFKLPRSLASSTVVGPSVRYYSIRAYALTKKNDALARKKGGITETTSSSIPVTVVELVGRDTFGPGVSKLVSAGVITLEARTLDTLFWNAEEGNEGAGRIEVVMNVKNFSQRKVSGLKLKLIRRLKPIPQINPSIGAPPKIVTVVLAIVSSAFDFKIGSTEGYSIGLDLPEVECCSSTREGKSFNVETLVKVELGEISVELPITICHPYSLPASTNQHHQSTDLRRGLTLPSQYRSSNEFEDDHNNFNELNSPLSPSLPSHYTHQMIQSDYQPLYDQFDYSTSRQQSPARSRYQEFDSAQFVQATFLQQPIYQSNYSTSPSPISPVYDNEYHSFPSLDQEFYQPDSSRDYQSRSPFTTSSALPAEPIYRDYQPVSLIPPQYPSSPLQMQRSDSTKSFRTPPPSSPSSKFHSPLPLANQYFPNSPSLPPLPFDEYLETIGEDGESQIGTGRSIFEAEIKARLREDEEERELVSVPALRSSHSSSGTSAEALEDMVEKEEEIRVEEKVEFRADSPIVSKGASIRVQDLFPPSPEGPVPRSRPNSTVYPSGVDGLSLLEASLARSVNRVVPVVPVATIDYVRATRGNPIQQSEMERTDSISTTFSTQTSTSSYNLSDASPSLTSNSTLASSVWSTCSDPIEAATCSDPIEAAITCSTSSRPALVIDKISRDSISPPSLESKPTSFELKSPLRSALKKPSSPAPISVREQGRRYSMDQFASNEKVEGEKKVMRGGRVSLAASGWSDLARDQSPTTTTLSASTSRAPGRLSMFTKSISSLSIEGKTVKSPVSDKSDHTWSELVRSPRVITNSSPTTVTNSSSMNSLATRPGPWVVVDSSEFIQSEESNKKERRGSKSFREILSRFQ